MRVLVEVFDGGSEAVRRWTDRGEVREAEKLQAQGSTIPQVCKRLQVSEQTFYRWRQKTAR